MRKHFLIAIPIVLVIAFVFTMIFGFGEEVEINRLYELSVIDAMYAEEEEMCELVTIDENDNLTTWNETADKVLLLTWNKYPDSYIEGTDVVLSYGAVWTFTDKEMILWYAENEEDIEDYQLRLNQLIGLMPEDDNSHFTAFWVSPEDIIRPAYNTDITSEEMELTRENMDEEYLYWFDNNIISSYYSEYQYPWTRLGYTYDWADNGTEYGLTEFLVKENSTVTVEYTMTTEEFLDYISTLD